MAELPSGRTAEIGNDETVSHFVFGSRKWNHFTAFYPDHRKIPVTLSIFRIDGMKETEIWSIGVSVWETRREKGDAASLQGRADLKAAMIREQGLEITASEPPPHHGNIVQWLPFAVSEDSKETAKAAKEAWQLAVTAFARNAQWTSFEQSSS